MDSIQVHDTPINGIAFGQGDGTVYTGASGGELVQWNREEPQGRDHVTQLPGKPEFGNVSSLTVGAFATNLHVGYSTGTLCSFNIPDGELITFREYHEDYIATLDSHPTANIVLSGSFDGDICLWEAQRAHPAEMFTNPLDAPVTAVSFSSNGDSFAAAGAETLVSIWDTDTLSRTRTFGNPLTTIQSLQYIPGKDSLAAVDMDGELRVLKSITGEEHLRVAVGEGGDYPMAVNPDGSQAIVGTNQSLNIYDLEDGSLVDYFRIPNAGVFSVACSHDGSLVAAGCGDGVARIYEAQSPN